MIDVGKDGEGRLSHWRQCSLEGAPPTHYERRIAVEFEGGVMTQYDSVDESDHNSATYRQDGTLITYEHRGDSSYGLTECGVDDWELSHISCEEGFGSGCGGEPKYQRRWSTMYQRDSQGRVESSQTSVDLPFEGSFGTGRSRPRTRTLTREVATAAKAKTCT